jgi:outer membrane cobalamin receptor
MVTVVRTRPDSTLRPPAVPLPAVLLLLGLLPGLPAQAEPATTALPPLEVLAKRDAGRDSGASRAWDAAALREASPRVLDEVLASEPSFSLYRRQSSLFGNPTSAGVSLRNTGATAASRTLVLRDGIPQNDPFGGWVYWARYDAAALESLRIVPAARASAWGSQSPAGVIQMDGRHPFEPRSIFQAGAGSHGTLRVSTFHQVADAARRRSVSVSAFGLESDGFHAVGSSQRGSIDRPLDTSLHGAEVKSAWRVAGDAVLEPMVSLYREDRGNGTPMARNSTDAADFALRLSSGNDEDSWQALLWHQRREFDSVFTSVIPSRTAETLALDQYDVPGRGTGAAFTRAWQPGGPWSLVAGFDARQLDGTTHETVGTFRNREAGGRQSLEGWFLTATRDVGAEARMDAGLRLDAWQLDDGRRIETSLATGALLRSAHPRDREGVEPSASIEYSREIRDDLIARVSAGTTFRLPTLNELHRPFRVRNDSVEANPDLVPERFASVEGGLDWQPTQRFSLDVSAFHHWIGDAIANVPVTDPVQIAALFGSIPPGGSGSQRRNVDEAAVLGLEVGADWSPLDRLTLHLGALWSETEFTKSADQPLLEGMPFPQAPELRLIADAEWRVAGSFSLFGGFEHGSSQFDDALATRFIPDYQSLRLGARWQIREITCQLRFDNLFDEEIGTGLSSDGIRTLAAPRSLWAGLEWAF